MKHTKQCPKCGSYDIVLVNGNAGAYGSGNNIPLGWSIFSAIMVDRYVCCQCGFSEEWLREKDLDKLKNSGKAVTL